MEISPDKAARANMCRTPPLISLFNVGRLCCDISDECQLVEALTRHKLSFLFSNAEANGKPPSVFQRGRINECL